MRGEGGRQVGEVRWVIIFPKLQVYGPVGTCKLLNLKLLNHHARLFKTLKEIDHPVVIGKNFWPLHGMKRTRLVYRC